MSALSQPSGTVTLVFTDIEGSTKLLEELGTDAYKDALSEHRRIVREACSRYSGYEVDYEGDAFFYAFSSAQDAVSAVSEAIAGLEEGPISIRVGIHTGEPALDPPKYVGVDVHFAARVMSAAHGGQVIVSAATAERIEFSLTDLGEHRLKDIEGAVSIFQLGDGGFPPLKTISNTNLPHPASSFVGRDAELEEVLSRIEQGARLVTLTGPGGTGKTRLAIEAASALVSEYKAGVFWVGLASLRDPVLVTETIGQTLGAKDGLASHIGERELLLLLDNLEQVVDCAPELSSLLESCPNLTLLVTSRELLRISGEVEYPVPPLAEPEAVSLFCERAQAEPSEEIAELCARLDSLPLAVELAAARTKALTPAQILERLSSRLDLLMGGRDADPRQQTLRATIEWSYELLTPEEQQFFARLSVFSGGCTLEAAEEVAEASLDTLQSLVEKNLLRFTPSDTGGRYWMLETIREYAGERLGESEDGEELALRHSECFLVLVESAEDQLLGVEPGPWFRRLDAEIDNIRAAVRWSVTNEPVFALRIVAALWYFLGNHGHVTEPSAWIDAAWTDAAPADVRLRVLRAKSAIANMTYDLPQLEDSSRHRLELARDVGDPHHEAGALHMLGSAAQYRGDNRRAAGLFEEERRVWNDLGDDLHVSNVDATLAVIAHDEGDLPRARNLLEDDLAVNRAIGGEVDVAWTLIQLGSVEADSGDAENARVHLSEALEIASRLDHLHSLFDVFFVIALSAIDRGRVRDGVVLAGVVDSMSAQLGRPVLHMRGRWIETLETARSVLGSLEFESAFALGVSLEPSERVYFALASLD